MKTDILIAKQTVTEQALLVSEQRCDSLLAATSDYVYTVTVNHGRSVATSMARAVKLSLGSVRGSSTTIQGFGIRWFMRKTDRRCSSKSLAS
jgi:transcriptional regulatory protein LevR